MNSAEKVSSNDEQLTSNNKEWDMTPPDDADEAVETVDDIERDPQAVCGLRKPGEELGHRERATLRTIAQAYKKEKRKGGSSDESLHSRVVSAFGRFLEVPGYGPFDGEETTAAQRARLEELYQMVVEEEKASRNIFEKIAANETARGAFAAVAATAVALGLASVISTMPGRAKTEDVSSLKEVQSVMAEDPAVAKEYEEEYGITVADVEEMIDETEPSAAE